MSETETQEIKKADTAQKEQKFFAPHQIILGALFGGIFAAAWMIRNNFLTLEKGERGNQTLVGAVLVLVAAFGLSQILPLVFDGRAFAIAIILFLTAIDTIVTILVIYFWKEHFYKKSAKVHSGWQVLWIILVTRVLVTLLLRLI